MPLRPFHTPGAGFEYRLTVALALAGVTIVSLLVIRLLLPWLVVGGLGLAGGWFWWRQKVRDQTLHQVFYAELVAHGGRISVLDFAIAAQITGSEARQFLDQRAKEFWGDFEPTAAGDVLYTFRSQRMVVEKPDLTVPDFTVIETAAISLTAADLARRLGCTEGDLTHQLTTPAFPDWSRQRDPDGCGWRYDAEGDRFWSVPKSP
jgi:hypothetical protein